MGKSIDLSGGNKPTPQPRGQVPPPAQPIGVRGNPPLPVGKPVVRQEPVTGQPGDPVMTPQERKVMENLGWQAGQPIPKNMAAIIAQVCKEAHEEASIDLPLPVEPNFKVKPPKMVNIEELSEEHRQRIREAMQQAVQLEQAEAEVSIEQQQMATLPPSIQQAIKTATTPGEEAKVTVTTEPAAPTSQPTAPSTDETGVAASRTHCTHCEWPLDVTDPTKVTYEDKQAWLHTFLGDKPFSKTFRLMGGALNLTFRTLTVAELDKIFVQISNERSAGKIANDAEGWERLNRFRLYLQLQRLSTSANEQDLPSGFTPETNPNADSYYENLGPLKPGETGLSLVEILIVAKVLKSEYHHRIALHTCNEFNRLVAKLEAMADNEGFWRATEPPH